MEQRVKWYPGGWRNRPLDGYGEREGGYIFSLNRRQDDDDPFAFRLWAYWRGRYFHVGGFPTVAEAQEAAEHWEDPESQKIPTVNL